MTSPIPTDPLGEIYAHWITELGYVPEARTELLRLIFDDWQRATAEPEQVTYRSSQLAGVPGIMVEPIGADAAQMLVFFHGGGFALGSSASHRKLAGHLAKVLGVHCFVADFSRAPEAKFPVQLTEGVAMFRALRDSGFDAADITFVGDSAGGNLAIATTFELMDAGSELPGRVITMSPWLNMENDGATIESNNDTDFLITREGLQGNIDRYLAGATSPTDPRANPLHRDFTGFPPLYICAGDIESLFSDSERLDALARAAGVDVTFSVGVGMQHVYPFLAGVHARADEELHLIADWFRARRS